MKSLLTYLLVLIAFQSNAQKWVDSTYAFQVDTNVVYGSSIDFAGVAQDLTLDIATPIGDSIPENGRPLLVAIHGGAFMSGSKDDSNPQKWMKDFAAKGYVGASVNYRLGMFHTPQFRNCNITWIFNTPWNCSNVADTAEWYRSYYRGVQDVRGAIRHLVIHAEDYNINPEMIFLIGESAGGFIALGAGFLDTLLEKSSEHYELSNVQRPNDLYENCSSVPIDSMQFERPDLGNINGGLNVFVQPYKIKGVASFYGAMFNNLFENNTKIAPELLYLFHQPNDLIVPYEYDQLLEGYANCGQTLGGCSNIFNRPFVHGSFGIKKIIDSLQANGVENLPECHFEATNNNADCWQQINTGYLGGHQIDNYQTRTQNVAVLFANCLNTDTLSNSSREIAYNEEVLLYPNPTRDFIRIEFSQSKWAESISIFDLNGKLVFEEMQVGSGTPIYLNKKQNLTEGVYLVLLQFKDRQIFKKLIVY